MAFIRSLPEMSFFDPVYPSDQIEISDEENDLLADGIPRPSFGERSNRNESNETLRNESIIHQDQSSEMISMSKIISRIKQIQNSIQQAQTMLESMEQFKHLVPDTNEQREKLHSIISNLEEQHASYVDLLNLISLSEQERSTILNQISTPHDDDDDDLSLRRHVQSPVRPRIESKIGFIPPLINSPDAEQTTRNDNSNYDSLVGSLKSDTINWKDQQSTSDDGTSDVEMEKNFMLHKEQLRAFQGQRRALLALQRRSEQQELTNQKSTNEEKDLLAGINNLRDRLRVLRNLYDQKHQVELHRVQNSSSIPTENRLKNLDHIRERLDELEQLVSYYQTDFNHQHDAELFIQSIDTQRIETADHDTSSKHLDQLSDDLTTKRLELEQAKSALTQLQQMVKTIHPDEYSPSTRSTPRQSPAKNNETDLCPNSTNVKMVAQHREIERLVESRHRLHTIKGQITSLQGSMTPPIPRSKTYEEKLNDSRNIRPTYQFHRQESASESEAMLSQIRMKQSNLYASDTIVGRSADDLNSQMREICRCLSTFIEEQKSFNRHIKQRLSTVTNPSISPSTDPMFNQFQQQVVTQGLIVNLNTAHREIAVLQSEINALQSENNRLTSSISFDNQYHRSKPRVPSQSRSRFDEQENQFFRNSNKISINRQDTETTPITELSKSFINRQHPITMAKENNYQEKLESRQSNEFLANEFHLQPSAVHSSATRDLDHADVHTLDLQVKSIMVQLIPYMRLHINETFNSSILRHLRERILFLFKQQPESARLIRYFPNQFLDILEKTTEKYSGTTIRESAADLIRDISDLSFDELVKYKIYENTNHTAVIRIANDDSDQESDIDLQENPTSADLQSNDQEYILVNRSINNHLVPKTEVEN